MKVGDVGDSGRVNTGREAVRPPGSMIQQRLARVRAVQCGPSSPRRVTVARDAEFPTTTSGGAVPGRFIRPPACAPSRKGGWGQNDGGAEEPVRVPQSIASRQFYARPRASRGSLLDSNTEAMWHIR